MQSDQLDSVLNQFRPAFKADGFDVRVQAVTPGGRVMIEILHTAQACEDCLMSDERLAEMFTTAFSRVLPEISGVELIHQNVA